MSCLKPSSMCVREHKTRAPMAGALASGLVIALALLRPDAAGGADVLRVPNQYTTIQAAINATSDGDTVIVADGVYAGPIDFGNPTGPQGPPKAITLHSENGPRKCIISGRGVGRGFYFHSGERPNTVVEGFTITAGTAKFGGGGIFCYADSNPTIRNCIITGNSTERVGGGIRCYLSSPTITNCIITGNTAAFYGGGIYCGGKEALTTSDPDIRNCLIVGNSAEFLGGAIHCADDSMPGIKNCTICNNSASLGGGVSCWNSSEPVLVNSILWFNRNRESSRRYLRPGPMVSGHVRDPSGNGVADVQVSCGQAAILSDLTTDAHGYYEFIQSAVYPLLTTNGKGEQILLADIESTIYVSYSTVEGGSVEAYVEAGYEIEWDDRGNKTDDPIFLVAPSGTWTADGKYDPAKCRVTLTNASANWDQGELAGKLVNPDTFQPLQFPIVENTSNTMTVLADARTVAGGTSWIVSGSNYRVYDYHLSPGSPCINAGNPNGDHANETDIDGERRVNLGRVDMGADEAGISSDPPFDGTLPKTQKNVVRIFFGASVSLPDVNPVTIVPLCGGEELDLADKFVFSVETTHIFDDTLVCIEKDLTDDPNNSGVLQDMTWYRIRPRPEFERYWPAAWGPLDLCALQGDVDGSGQVDDDDFYAILEALRDPQARSRADVDGNGQVLGDDFDLVDDRLGNTKPGKPTCGGGGDGQGSGTSADEPNVLSPGGGGDGQGSGTSADEPNVPALSPGSGETPSSEPNNQRHSLLPSPAPPAAQPLPGCCASGGISQLGMFWVLCWLGLIGLYFRDRRPRKR